MSWFGKLSRTQKLLFGAVICLVGMPVFVILHNVFDMLGGLASDVAILGLVLTALSVGSFFLALFICPAVAGLLFLGALYVYMQQRSSRGGLRLLVIAIAAVAILSILFWFLESLASSHIERDAEAGFNGGFETVRAGYPANWYVYHRSIEDGDYELGFDTDAVDGDRSLRLRVHRVSGPSWFAPGLFQVVDAIEGGAYRVRFWLKNEGCLVDLRIESESVDSREPRNPIQTRVPGAETGEAQW